MRLEGQPDRTALDHGQQLHHPRDRLLVAPGLSLAAREAEALAGLKSATVLWRTGKTGNCQVVVTAEYSADEPTESRPLNWPVSG